MKRVDVDGFINKYFPGTSSSSNRGKCLHMFFSSLNDQVFPSSFDISQTSVLVEDGTPLSMMAFFLYLHRHIFFVSLMHYASFSPSVSLSLSLSLPNFVIYTVRRSGTSKKIMSACILSLLCTSIMSLTSDVSEHIYISIYQRSQRTVQSFLLSKSS